MTLAPTRIAQTTREAKKAYSRNGRGQLPERQKRQLERAVELEQRAARIREADERRKIAKRKREEKERREREARVQNGFGLATQLIGFSHSQARMKSGMEAFVGLKKRKKDKRVPEKVVQPEKEPWDDSDSGGTLEPPHLERKSSGEQWFDDELDDGSLLEAHDLAMFDAVECPGEELGSVQPPTPETVAKKVRFAALDTKPLISRPSAEADFVRSHGPVNKTIEAVLAQLPDPLIELLSQDMSTNEPIWKPASSLLHKLNPPGLPPHRLRVKVGCTVMLLRDLDSSSSLVAKSSHLCVLRVENERLECLVLDGQLAGTKTFLTRVSFASKYRTEDKFSFQRIQFPIKVSTTVVKHEMLPRKASQSRFKAPSVTDRPSEPIVTLNRPSTTASVPRPSTGGDKKFRPLGLPTPDMLVKPVIESTIIPDRWEDFLDTATQIARELSSDCLTDTGPMDATSNVLPLYTQDLDFTVDDLEERRLGGPSMARKPSAKSQKSLPRECFSAPRPSQGGSLPASTNPPMPNPIRPQHSPQASIERRRTGNTITPNASKQTEASDSFKDFGLSTQEVTSFFADDESTMFSSSSPRIAV